MAGLGPLREVPSNRALATLDCQATLPVPGEVLTPDDADASSDRTHSSMPGLEYPTESEDLDIETDSVTIQAMHPGL